jgi:hypothetical protein
MLKNFIRNVWLFRKELVWFSAWDFDYNIKIFYRSLQISKEFYESGKPVISEPEKIAEEIGIFLKYMDNYHNAFELARIEMGVSEEGVANLNIFEAKKFNKLWMKHERENWNNAMDYLKKHMNGWWD